MSNILTEPRNFRIDDVELNWPKLSKPVNPFGTEQWELQIATKDEEVAKDWKANHLNVKEGTGGDKGIWHVQLKRKVKKADGSENGKVRVVGRDAKPIEADNLGNGSRGNVILYQYPYDAMGRKGIATSLTAVQVSKFVEYIPTSDFSPMDEGDSNSTEESEFSPEEPPKKVARKKSPTPKSLENVVKDWK